MTVVEAVFAIIKDGLRHGDKVKISGFGTFIVNHKHARRGRNPQTGDPITIDSRRVLSFKPSQVLKERVNNGTAGSHDPKQHASQSSPAENRPRRPPRGPRIPERGLKIGEAARALGVETYVLRFWETQFPFLKPKHSRTSIASTRAISRFWALSSGCCISRASRSPARTSTSRNTESTR